MKKDIYQISLWEDYVVPATNTVPEHYEEQLLGIIGSDTMTAEYRVIEPKLIQNINGTNILTFKVYYTYIDTETGERQDNPFIKLLVNERKVKCLWKEQWYDFVIKSIQEDSSGKSITYTCKDLYINELSKTGFNLEFDNELENNQGTAQELGAKILEGTDWQVASEGQDIVQQTIEEPLFLVQIQTAITVYKSNGKDTYEIPSSKKILVPYSVTQTPYPQIFQFFYDEDENYAKYQEDNSVHLTGLDCSLLKNPIYSVTDDGTFTLKFGTTTVLTIPNTQPLSDWRADRPIRAPLQEYSSLVGRYCYVYKGYAGKKIYKYITTEYNDPTVVLNLVVNNKEFKDTTGWIGEGMSWQLYPPYTDISNIESYSATTYLGLQGGKTIYNAGLQKSSMYIEGGFQKGEKYIFRVKGYQTLGGAKLTTNYHIDPKVCSHDNNFTPLATSDANYINYFDVGTAIQNGDWIEYPMTCQVSIPRSKITTSNIGLFITPVISCWIEEFQFFKEVYGKDSDGNSTRINPGEMDKNSVATEVYCYFDSATTVLDEKDIEYLWKATSDWSGSSAPEPQYSIDADGNYTYEKIRSITGKNSNRFNLLQSVAETFECWVRFEIKHNENTGKILYEDGKPQKFVYFKNEVGEENGCGFVYGIDLKTISRSINSDQITSKVVVVPNTTQYAENGVCEIAQSEYNPCKENFILNFDYYINQGLLDGGAVNKDLWLSSASGGLGYYPSLKEKNEEYYKSVEENVARKLEHDKQNSTLQLYQQYLTSTTEQITSTKSDIARLAGLSSYDAARVTSYVKEHPGFEKLETLIVTLKTLEGQKTDYQGIYGNLKKSVDALKKAIEAAEARQTKLLEEIDTLHKAFYEKYSRFIQEGSWTSQNYLDENLYYLDAKSVAYTSARPQISYNISVLRLSALDEFKNKVFRIGDISYIEDTEFFGYTYIATESGKIRSPYREKVLISEITSNFDSPEKDSFKVQNYKTQFEDLFQRITATTQSLQYSVGEYQRASDVVEGTGVINNETLQSSIARNEQLIFSSQNNTIVKDATGLTVIDASNPSNQTKITAGGLFITTDGGLTWKNAIRGEGIATQYLTAGAINTENITILDGINPSFRWDSYGITAYKKNVSDNGILLGYTSNQFVRYDQYGIYGVKDITIQDASGEYKPSSEDQIWNDASFGLTWKGFFLKNKYGAGLVEISSEKDINISDGTNDRIRIGKLSGDGTTENPYTFGIRINDATGAIVMETNSDGTLWLKDSLNVETTDSGLKVAIGKLGERDDSGLAQVINANDAFIVYEDGSVRALNGNFTGVINATDGFFSGVINATDGSFTGIINATGGTIGSIQITNEGLTVGNGGFEITKTGVDGTIEKLLYVDDEGNLKITGDLESAGGYFSGELRAPTGTIGGFVIEENLLYSLGQDENGSPNIVLKGTEGKIVARDIELGVGAVIKDYIKLGNAFLQNPDIHDNKFIEIKDENGQPIISLTDTGIFTLGSLVFNGINSTISGKNWGITPDEARFGNVIAQGGTIENVIFKTSSIQTVGGLMIFKPTSHGVGEGNIFTLDEENSFFQKGDFVSITSVGERSFSIETYIVDKNGLEVILAENVEGAEAITKLASASWADGRAVSLSDELLIGVNPNPAGLGKDAHLFRSGFSFVEPKLGEDGKSLEYNAPSLFLGNLSSLGIQNVSGFGLYSDNVFLKGTLTTKTGADTYAGINTLSGVLSNKARFTTQGKIVIWAGASNFDESSIQNAPFFVTDNGNLFARQGVFEGSILTNSTIQGADIYAARIHGGTQESDGVAALTIYDTAAGIIFKKNFDENNKENGGQETFRISADGFIQNGIEFISFEDEGVQFSGNRARMVQFQTQFENASLIMKGTSLYKGISVDSGNTQVLSKIDFSTGDKEQIDFIIGERIASFTNEEAIFDKKTVLRDNVLMGDINTVYVSYQKVAKGYDVYVYTNENVDVSSNIVDIAVAGYAIAG